MTNLKQITFKEFITLQRGFDLPKNRRVDGKYPVVASTSIQGYHAEYKVKPPGVATGRSGSLGQVIFIDQPFWPLNTTLWVKNFKNNVPKYVYYFLQTLGLEKYNSGAGVPTLNRNHLDSLIIEIHDVPDQRKIAAILSAYDDLIENNARRIKILEEMASALYREWFVNFRFPGHEKVGMKESELGLKPEGWEAMRLGDLAEEVRRGVNPEEVDPETPYFGLEHLPRKSIALSEWGTADQVNSTKLAFRKGEILFGKIRPYFHKVGVAPVNGICSSDTIVISPKKPDYFSIVLCCVSSEDFVNHSTQTSQGTKMPRANWKVLVNYPVMLPPDPLKTNFDNLVRDIVSQIQNMVHRNRNLRRTRDLLLPQLISGKIDIENVKINDLS